jgi:hypothetical protein
MCYNLVEALNLLICLRKSSFSEQDHAAHYGDSIVEEAVSGNSWHLKHNAQDTGNCAFKIYPSVRLGKAVPQISSWALYLFKKMVLPRLTIFSRR